MILYAYYIVYQGVLASMSRTICIYQDFLTEAHKTQIREAAGKAGFTPCFFTCDQVEEAKACLRDCEILYTCDPEILRSASASLQWCCSASAGVDVFCKDDGMFQNPACLLTNSNCYGVTIAEHIVMVTLMLLRRMPAYQAVIRNREWGDPLPIRSIQGTSFTLLGTGNIGVNTARYLRNMGAAHITGVSRSGKPHPAFDEVFPISRLDDLLPQAHLLVMSLPETAETVHILNRERIALLPPDACVINVGRGTAIDQEALAEALDGGRIAGAALDVVDPEPLPRDHFLWDTKNLVLTPHVSGNLTLDSTCDLNVEMFCRDLENYGAGRPLSRLVDRKRGY